MPDSVYSNMNTNITYFNKFLSLYAYLHTLNLNFVYKQHNTPSFHVFMHATHVFLTKNFNPNLILVINRLTKNRLVNSVEANNQIERNRTWHTPDFLFSYIN